MADVLWKELHGGSLRFLSRNRSSPENRMAHQTSISELTDQETILQPALQTALISMLKNLSICPVWGTNWVQCFKAVLLWVEARKKMCMFPRTCMTSDGWQLQRRVQQHPQTRPLCSSSQYRHLQSGREKGQGHSYLKQKCSLSSDAPGEELPYSRHQLSISVSCSLSFPANSYFLKQHF